ncbi:UDP-N-acetylmuramate dehydrogenase [Microbacterium halimionae]|uniref:UDP-N-acetylenolpyruvoylglucosamine reductase n=2 Tax=Microbacterium halimionae TaxID=1526413 RepID=A0A7W3JQ15_9MICO|nr:UDP-N-acetylmuramate dehydrogenase [Microbacterium halimionae]NII94906.1 UDP-N-acetylmuramate dehydrogenase [Microbacterium halimionae]
MTILDGSLVPFCIIGEGSNILFDDRGFEGVIMVIGRRMSKTRISGNTVWAEAGTPIPRLALEVGAQGLTGLEHAVGIPGTLGGLILMNGGSQRKGIGTTVRRVTCVDRNGEILEMTQAECEFSYRGSRLQATDAAIVEAELELGSGSAADIKAEMEEIVASRNARFPQNLPSCGSTFVSDPKLYATIGAPGKAIEAVGLRGWRRGNAQISEQHANFFVNLGNASSADILWLIALARNSVRDVTGVAMDCEVRYVDVSGEASPAHIAATARWGEQLTSSSLSA